MRAGDFVSSGLIRERSTEVVARPGPSPPMITMTV
jgi:hypothetical protein